MGCKICFHTETAGQLTFSSCNVGSISSCLSELSATVTAAAGSASPNHLSVDVAGAGGGVKRAGNNKRQRRKEGHAEGQQNLSLGNSS